MDYLNRIVSKLKQRLTTQIKQCFKEPLNNYLKAKCALKLLFRIQSVFPKNKENSEKIMKEIETSIIKQKDTLHKDLVTLAQSYLNRLKQTTGRVKEPEKVDEAKEKKVERKEEKKEERKEERKDERKYETLGKR